MERKRQRLQNRRGAIMVLAAVTISALAIMLAVVLDVSRLYVQKNDLQTGTDAGALAGALRLSKATSNVADSAVATANRNKVLNATPTFLTSNVLCGVWDGLPVNGTTPNAWHAGSPHALPCTASDNAVQVIGTSPTSYVFSTLLNAQAGTVQDTASAWVAPTVDGSACIKPFALSYQTLLTTLNTARLASSYPTRSGTTLDSYDYALLQSKASSLLFCLKDGSAKANGDTTATNGPKCNTQATPGSYQIVGLVPGDNSAQSYYAELSAQCSEDITIGAGQIIDVQTGNIVGPTNKGVNNYCPNGNSAPCYMKFVLYDDYTVSGTTPPTGTATDGASCNGGSSGTNPCYNIVTIGAGVISAPAHQGMLEGYFTLMMDPGGHVGTTPGLLKTIVLVQ